MAKARKVVITCAVTGAIHTPSMSPHLPVTPDEIIAARDGGGRSRRRDPASCTPAIRRPASPTRRRRRSGVSCRASSRRPMPSSTSRPAAAPTCASRSACKPAATFKPEVASLNMGSINFGLFQLLDRYKEFKHDWEPQSLESTRDLVFRNSFKDIEYILQTCYGNDTRFEFECYDIAHLYNLKHFLDRGLVKPPLFVQSVFGILGGIGTHPEDVMHMKRTADRLFGDQYRWSVLGAGASQMRIAAQAAAMGGNVRVGLEDSLWAGPGKLARVERRAGAARAPDPGRARARDRDARRGARDPGPQGSRQGRLLTPEAHPQPHRALTRPRLQRKRLSDRSHRSRSPCSCTARSPCQRIRPRSCARADVAAAGLLSQALHRFTDNRQGRRVWTSRSASKRSRKRRKKLSNWGRWGKDDQIGTLNHVTPRGYRRRREAGQERQGLRARHPARPERTADRPVRRPLQSDPPDARHRHRRHRRPAGLEQDPLRRRHADAAACRAPRTGTRSAISSTRTRPITATTPS